MALGSTTSANKLKKGVSIIYKVLEEWQHPGIFMNMYNGDRDVTNMTCTDAWNKVLKPQLDASKFMDEVNAVCDENGFNITIPTQKTACHELVSQAADLHGLTPSGAGNYIREAFLAKNILETINREDPLIG